MPRKLKLMLLLAWLTCMQANASKPDSLRHIGYSIGLQPAQVVSWDKYSTKFIKKKNVLSFMAEANYTALPSDSNAIDADFGYPSLSIGFRYSLNDVTFHRSPDPAWGLAEEVDYDSNMGGIATLYSTFTRPFFRHQHWSADYTLGTGIGYTRRIYNNTDNIDNELLGTRWLIYFTAGLHATWHFAPKWGLRMGLDFYHHSNGALYRPNKGANVLGPTIGLSYEPNYDYLSEQKSGTYFSKQPFRPYFFTKITAGIGGKALHEDWQLTQFGTPKGEEDYLLHTARLHVPICSPMGFRHRFRFLPYKLYRPSQGNRRGCQPSLRSQTLVDGNCRKTRSLLSSAHGKHVYWDLSLPKTRLQCLHHGAPRLRAHRCAICHPWLRWTDRRLCR